MQLSPVTLAPATCTFCRRTPDSPNELFVDTLLFAQRGPARERVYVCPECAGRIANALNWVDPKDYADLEDRYEMAAAVRDSVQAELDASKEDVLTWIKGVVAEAKPAPARKPRVQPSA